MLITFKTAKLAKELGYNLIATHYYDSDNPLSSNVQLLKNSRWGPEVGSIWGDGEIDEESKLPAYMLIPHNQAPIQSELQRWLRIEYDIIVSVLISGAQSHQYILHGPGRSYVKTVENSITFENKDNNFQDTLEKGLVAGLVLLKELKNINYESI
jgi:hypothetical protein